MNSKTRSPFTDVQRLLKWILVLMVMAVAAFLSLALFTFVVLPFWGWDELVDSFKRHRAGESTTTKEALISVAMLASVGVWFLALVLWARLLGDGPRGKHK